MNSSSYRLDHEDHDYEDPLGLNRPPNKPLARLSETFAIDAVCYTEKDLQQIIQTVLTAQAPKEACGKRLKAKLPDLYHGKSHIEYYNFVSSMMVILPLLGRLDPIKYCLWLLTSEIKSTSNSSSISERQKPRVPFQSSETSPKSSSKKP